MSRSKDAWAPWPDYGCGGQPAEEEFRSSDSSGPDLFHRIVEDEIINVLDTETTGMERDARLVEIAVVRIRLPSCEVLGRAVQLINPGVPIPPRVIFIHHITDAMVADKPKADKVLPAVLEFVGKAPILAHNASYDARILRSELARVGIPAPGVEVFDSIKIAKAVLPKGTVPNMQLETLVSHFRAADKYKHRAMADTMALVGVLRHLLAASGGKSLRELAGKAVIL